MDSLAANAEDFCCLGDGVELLGRPFHCREILHHRAGIRQEKL
jgi:hypothetical protein